MKFNPILIRYFVGALVISLCLCCISSCQSNLQHITNKAVMTDSVGAVSGSGSTISGDSTFEVTTMAAVFYGPDSSEIDSLTKANKQQYLSMADEYKHLQALGEEFIRKKNTKVFVTTKRYLVFTNNAGRPYVIDRKKSGHTWGLLLYDHEFAPREADLKKVEFEYLQYFMK